MEKKIEKKTIKNLEELRGLSKEEVERQISRGLVNYDTSPKSKSIRSIILGNVFTLFNIINFLLGLAVFAVGSYKNIFFLGIIICNTAISIIQEIKSKRAVDKLSVLAETKVTCLRDGEKKKIGINDIEYLKQEIKLLQIVLF